MLLYTVSARDPQAPPNVFDGLALLLVVAALAVDVLALTAIAGRITEFGFTANRTAALGENLVLLCNLAWSAWLYARFLRGARRVRLAPALADGVPACLWGVGGGRRGCIPTAVRVCVRFRVQATVYGG